MKGTIMERYPKLFKRFEYPFKQDMSTEYKEKALKELNDWYDSLSKEELDILECKLFLY